MSRLTGNEQWIKEGRRGVEILATKDHREEPMWWPVVSVEMDSGLITIDVCGMAENWGLDDVAAIRIGDGTLVPWECFYDQPEEKQKRQEIEIRI